MPSRMLQSGGLRRLRRMRTGLERFKEFLVAALGYAAAGEGLRIVRPEIASTCARLQTRFKYRLILWATMTGR